MALRPGVELGPYRLLNRVGRGGMADVFAAEHVGLGKRVAVKVLHHHLAEREDVVRRFALEAKAAARIRHPNIVDVSDVGVSDGISYLVMELLEGEPLSRYLSRVGALTPRQSAILMTPVIAAVAHAHRAGVLHRDLKPANIFLTRDAGGAMLPKVLDFGISKVLGETQGALTMTNSFVGTPAHASPEQVIGLRDIDARSDQYSLGVVLYLCVTGIHPFDPDGPLFEVLRAVSEGRVTRPSELRPDLPPAFEAIVLRAMSKLRDDRYASLDELLSALAPFAANSAPSELPLNDIDDDEAGIPDFAPAPSSSGVRGAAPRPPLPETLASNEVSFPTPLPSHHAGASRPATPGYTPTPIAHAGTLPSGHPGPRASSTPVVAAASASGGPNRVVVLLLVALIMVVLGVGGSVLAVLLFSPSPAVRTAPRGAPSTARGSTAPTETEVRVLETNAPAIAPDPLEETQEIPIENAAPTETGEASAMQIDEPALDPSTGGDHASSDRDRRRRVRSPMEEPPAEPAMEAVPERTGTDIRDPWAE